MGMIGKALAGLGKGMVQASLIQLESNAQEMRMKRLAEFEGTIAGKAASAKHTLEREDKYTDTAVEEAYKANAAAQKHEYDKELEGIKQQGDKTSPDKKIQDMVKRGVPYDIAQGKVDGTIQEAKDLDGNTTFVNIASGRVIGTLKSGLDGTGWVPVSGAESDMDALPTQAELDRAAAELNRGGNVPRGTSQQPKAQQSTLEKTQTQQFKPDLSAQRGTDRNPHVPQSEAEYQAIKPGETYIDPDDGKLYRKPQQEKQSA